jgi:hypothetical protein
MRGQTASDAPNRQVADFLVNLSQTLRSDLANLSRVEPEDEWTRLARTMKVYNGNLDDQKKTSNDDTTYVFLNIPSQRGLMLETTADQRSLELRRGTLIVPLKRNAFDELEPTTLFVTSGPALAQFGIIDSNVVRSKVKDRTFTVSMMSEHLLSFAFGINEGQEDTNDNETSQ